MSRKPNVEPRTKITAEVPLALRQAVVALAEKEDTSVTRLMEEAFRRLLEEREAWR